MNENLTHQCEYKEKIIYVKVGDIFNFKGGRSTFPFISKGEETKSLWEMKSNQGDFV